VKIVAPDVIDALQRPQQFVSGGLAMCRCDADDRAAGHHEYHGKIREFRDRAPCNPLNGPVRKPPTVAIGGVDQSARPCDATST
jgi:hypothetical protein